MNIDKHRPMSVLLVAENISMKQSGETSIPYYFLDRFLKQRIAVQAICHARVREDLRQSLSPAVFKRIHFVEDSWLQRLLYAVGKKFPYRIEDLVFGQAIHVLTQMRMRHRVRDLIDEHGIEVVFEPVPIAPKALSFMFGLGVPVVIGPMCGGLELPPAFRRMDGAVVQRTIQAARLLATLMHRLIPGKLQAQALLVGNRRTAKALPGGIRGRIHEVVESGVDLARWPPKDYASASKSDGVVRFVFCGRLVDWKGAQYLVKAFAPLARKGGVHLDLIGDGTLFESIRQQVAAQGISGAVELHGRVPLERCIELMRGGDVYVMPSLRECGGLALLEAMAIGLPIVATHWMGPAEYLNPSCSILVDPDSEQSFVDGFTAAMERLAGDANLRRALGEGARRRVHSGYFGWENKVDRVLEILAEVVSDARRASDQKRAASLGSATDVPTVY